MEVFVVDNGSVDGSGEWVKDRFSEVNFIENKLNLGFAKANNQALILSKGKYVLLLNPDTQVKEGAIERLCSLMDSLPEAGMAGAQLLNADGSKQNSIANFPSLATELLNKGLLRWFFPEMFPGKERNYVEPIEVDSVIGACMMVRRQAMEQVGLLDEDYFLFLEETDWCYRMKRAGWKVVHAPRAEVTHFQGKSAERERRRARVEYYRSRYLFFKKHRGQFQWGILLVGLVFKLMVEWVSMGMACLISVFTIQRWKERFFLYTYLMVWHLKGCPEGMGLKPLARLLIWLAGLSGRLCYRLEISRVGNAIIDANRQGYWRAKLGQLGTDSYIFRNVAIHGPKSVMIGSHVHIAEFVHIWGGGGVYIGDNVAIASHTVITSQTHDKYAKLFRNSYRAMPVKIEENVWIGAGAVILPGVTIGKGSVIGAQAVVTRDVPPRSLVLGVPARVVEQLPHE